MMNWFTPLSESTAGYRVTIGSDWAPIWSYEELMRRDASAVYGDLLPIFGRSDLNIVNLECVLSDAGAPIPKAGPCLRGDREVGIKSLLAAPFHVVTLANNHSMDYGPDSLRDTLEAVRGAGIATVGAGMNGAEAAEPLRFPPTEQRPALAILNCGEGEACASLDDGPGANVYEPTVQEAQIQMLKAAGYTVIVIFHGGREMAASPPPYVVKGMRRFAKAGADAVIAHHPHVPQGVELFEGVPIAYSQGNFVFRRGSEFYYPNVGYLVHLDLLAAGGVASVSLTPYMMKAEGVFALQGEEREALIDEIKLLSSLLEKDQAIEDLWNAFADEYGKGWQSVLDQLTASFVEYAESPDSAVARLHHYFFAPAHRHYFADAFKRRKLGSFGNSPEWAREWVRRWKERPIGANSGVDV